jgi:hypothetical protein
MLQDDFVKSHPKSPFRSPDWRWCRATAIVAAPRRVSRNREDPTTRRAVSFIRATRKAASEKAHRRIAIAYPDLFTACQLMQNGGRRQLELESRVLARQTSELIGEVMALPLHTVQAFRTLYFDVEDLIDAASYINNVVLGLNGPSTASAETWMRALAYSRGPQVIEPFLDFLEHSTEIHNLAIPEGRQRESLALFLAVKALDVEAKDLARLRKLAPIIFSQTQKPDRYVPVPAVFAAMAERSLPRLPFRASDEASSPQSTARFPKAHGKVAS